MVGVVPGTKPWSSRPPLDSGSQADYIIRAVGSVALDEETFLRAGGTKENARMPDDLGGAILLINSIIDKDNLPFIGGYMADIEILHQMHCLNFVRMAVYAEHYRDIAPEWQDSNRTFNIHLGNTAFHLT